MKKYCALLSFSLMTACVQPGGKISLANPHVQVVKDMFEAFNAHDWPKMAACYADTARFLDPEHGADMVTLTRAQMVKKYQELQRQFPDVQDDVQTIYGDKNHITVEFVSTATGEGGKKWRLPICVVFTVENGKIIQDRTYYHEPVY
ncbi:nuclear transport factor 2 family protein [Chitinophaga qingshengii]|uniref:Nuclear transport factor 2 family protein n=1 Tax=Chitinophaga qingshengii TaxID=1569794 RepID=A0ABR7TS11_9BACT|nr:nuclear transport factor 2 family protein [Chitinophaga qingshengii]MBC9933275.1 nuclear transport factor 2 family protein [Chitinophaga qingshengii]